MRAAICRAGLSDGLQPDGRRSERCFDRPRRLAALRCHQQFFAGDGSAAFVPGTILQRQYTILTSAGLGGTTFGGVVIANQPNFAASLSYTGNNVLLNIGADLGAGLGLAINQQNVANVLNNSLNSGGVLPPNLLAAFGLTGG